MAATSIDVSTLDYSLSSGLLSPIQSNLSFHYSPDVAITSLSTHNGAINSQYGYLFTPDILDPACMAASAPYVPPNTTRLSDLPRKSTYIGLIAIAPWTNSQCIFELFQTVGHINAFFVYLPGNDTNAPPTISADAWGISDGGHYKTKTSFPIYALPSQAGQTIINALAQYSGNVSDLPYGQQLSQIYNSTDYIRLTMNYGTTGFENGKANIPVWGFFVLIVGAMLAFAASISGFLHYKQYRRRVGLRRRVASGEVDLEALGIKRLTIPQKVLDTMPLYTYGTGAAATTHKAGSDTSTQATQLDAKQVESTTSSRASSVDPHKRPAAAARATSYRPTPLDQPTCAICLDDFVPASEAGKKQPGSDDLTATAQGTTVRELPCRHIFHPECVDAFLKDNSSLCPLCKRTALPKGYCPPKITNAMVRREMRARRLRPGQLEAGVLVDRAEAAVSRRPRDPNWRYGQGRPAVPEVVVDSAAPTEMGTPMQNLTPASSRTMERHSPATLTSPPAPLHHAEFSETIDSAVTRVAAVQPPATPGRREWARERAIAMLGGRIAPDDPDEEERRQMSGWRRAITKLFPGLIRR